MTTPNPNDSNYIITEQFGAGANPAYIRLPIPVPDQSGTTPNQASFTTGFPPSTMTAEASGGLPPFGQDLNGILSMISANVAALSSGSLPVFSATRATAISGYSAGSLVAMTNGQGYWLCTTNANSQNPETPGSTGWLPVARTGEVSIALTTGTVTLTPAQAAYPIILFTGTLTGNVTVVFPAWAGTSWTVASQTSAGSFTITLRTAAAGSSVPLASATGYSAAQNVFSDGTNLYTNNVSTAGLAPLASPAFTGVPTAPTPGVGSNTTQLSTTAFVNAAIAAALAAYAPLASPTLGGVPTAPTPPLTDSSARLATTAFVKAVAGLAVTNGFVANSGLNITLQGGDIQLRWGQASQINGTQTHAFATPFTNVCWVVLPVVVTSTGVEFFSVISISTTGFSQYANNSCNLFYLAIGF